jgi:hypothetical protein
MTAVAAAALEDKSKPMKTKGKAGAKIKETSISEEKQHRRDSPYCVPNKNIRKCVSATFILY